MSHTIRSLSSGAAFEGAAVGINTPEFHRALEEWSKTASTDRRLEDWLWTAETVWESGAFAREMSGEVAGIGGSSWATPTLLLEFNSGDEERYSIGCGDPPKKRPAHTFCISEGAMSGPCNDAISQVPLKYA